MAGSRSRAENDQYLVKRESKRNSNDYGDCVRTTQESM